MSDHFQKQIAFLGIDSSPSFVRAGGQGLLRALHPHPQGEFPVRPVFRYGRRAASPPLEFKRVYNEQWLLERHNYQTPTQVRHNFDQELAKAA